MLESSIQETPTAAQLAQESRTLRPRGGDASRVTPGAQLNVESTSENPDAAPLSQRARSEQPGGMVSLNALGGPPLPLAARGPSPAGGEGSYGFRPFP